MRLAVNGFGRMGRLAVRALLQRAELDAFELVAVNEPHADAETMATLLEFDSVQGRFGETCRGAGERLEIGARSVAFTREEDPAALDWRAVGVDLVLECSGKFRSPEAVQPHFDRGASSVVVSAPVTGGVPNIVMGVNHEAFDLGAQALLSAASCTTNCLAPAVMVVHQELGIERGVVTTIHNPTNTQRVHDAPHKDPRRARASMLSLIPTSTNSAHAVTQVIPELKGKLDSIAVRVPVMNASITDAVFQVARDTTVEEVNGILAQAAASARLDGILGVEERPLVSADFARDPRSGIVDARSTRVTDRRLVKLLLWYDNEWGYANRLVELATLRARAVAATATS